MAEGHAVSLTHLTEWGVGTMLGARLVAAKDAIGVQREFEALGLRPDKAACDGHPVSISGRVPSGQPDHHIPTCPRCAVLRDEVLETGRVPAGVGTGAKP